MVVHGVVSHLGPLEYLYKKTQTGKVPDTIAFHLPRNAIGPLA